AGSQTSSVPSAVHQTLAATELSSPCSRPAPSFATAESWIGAARAPSRTTVPSAATSSTPGAKRPCCQPANWPTVYAIEFQTPQTRTATTTIVIAIDVQRTGPQRHVSPTHAIGSGIRKYRPKYIVTGPSGQS